MDVRDECSVAADGERVGVCGGACHNESAAGDLHCADGALVVVVEGALRC